MKEKSDQRREQGVKEKSAQRGDEGRVAHAVAAVYQSLPCYKLQAAYQVLHLQV